MDASTKGSEDGGKSFHSLSNEFRHLDDHALWIDPNNIEHLIIGGGGGVYKSWDRGQKWRHAQNLPLGQFYRIQPDNESPFYNVCGRTQDNASLCNFINLISTISYLFYCFNLKFFGIPFAFAHKHLSCKLDCNC